MSLAACSSLRSRVTSRHLAHGEIEFNALTSFLEAFADAQNRLHAGGEHGTYLIDDIGVIFRMVFAAFGVADDDV